VIARSANRGPLSDREKSEFKLRHYPKYLKVRALITGSTRGFLGPDLPARRLCRARVVHIAEPVDLYELTSSSRPDWLALSSGYEEALGDFERGDYGKAARILGALTESTGDGPSLVLLARAV
jgi:hypothetical protein